MAIDKLEEIVRDNIYMEMCRCCPNAKSCHNSCENCNDYEEQVEKELNKYRKVR